jgi:hypothetical protein
MFPRASKAITHASLLSTTPNDGRTLLHRLIPFLQVEAGDPFSGAKRMDLYEGHSSARARQLTSSAIEEETLT